MIKYNSNPLLFATLDKTCIIAVMMFQYETPQLIMRTGNRRDARMVYEFYQRNLREFALYEPIDMTAAKTLVYFERLLEIEFNLFKEGEVFRYYLFTKTNPFRIVGTLSFRELHFAPHTLSAQLGYKIDRDFRRRGYATESIYAGCSALFREEKLHRIEATVLPDNVASFRLLEKLGFVREGLLREKILLNGVWKDHYLYALLNK